MLPGFWPFKIWSTPVRLYARFLSGDRTTTARIGPPRVVRVANKTEGGNFSSTY
jgi:hypothetical protein